MKVFWFDVETSGLDPDKNEIVQLAYEMRTDGSLVQQRDLLMAPEFPDRIEQPALDVQKKTKEDLLAYPDRRRQWSVFIDDLNGWIDKFDKSDKCWYGGYNVDFDIRFLWGQVKRWNVQYFGSFFNGYRIDPYPIVQFMASCAKIEKLRNYKLETVCEHLKIEIKAHDAASDIQATQKIASYISSRIMEV